jgi:hypothetical protein
MGLCLSLITLHVGVTQTTRHLQNTLTTHCLALHKITVCTAQVVAVAPTTIMVTQDLAQAVILAVFALT